MRVCYVNAQSVCNKTLPISDFICESDFDVIAITETWLKSTIDATIVRELTPTGYSQKLLSRSSRKGGGVALLYKSTICIKKPVHNVYHTFEHI